MGHCFAENLRALRLQRGLTQSQLANHFEVNRTTVSAWEDARAEPRVALLLQLASFFEVSIDALIYGNLKEGKVNDALLGRLRVLPIAVDAHSNRELITVVPVRATAGYLKGYGDLEYIASLPTFQLPVNELPQDQTLRMFQIEGESMLPIRSGSYVLASFVEDLSSAGHRKAYIAVTRDDGVVFKRIENRMHETGGLLLHSDNADFAPFEVALNDVLELWQARAVIAFDTSEPRQSESRAIMEALHRIEARLDAQHTKNVS